MLETFAEIIRLTLEDLAKRHAAIALPPGQSLHDWTQQTIVSMFGAAQLSSGESDEEVVTVDLPEDALFGDEASARHLLKLAMPEEVSRGAPDARSSDVLAESYAQASTELGVRVNDLREERDLARSRLAELKLALELAEQPAGEGEVEDRAQRILTILMRSADAANASLLLTTTDPPQIMVLPPLVSDPLARTSWGAGHLHELRDLAEARLEDGRELTGARQRAGRDRARVRVGGARAAALGGARARARHPVLPAAHGAAPRRHARAHRLPGPDPGGPARGGGGARGQGERRPHARGLARVGGGDRVAADAAAGRHGAPRRRCSSRTCSRRCACPG